MPRFNIKVKFRNTQVNVYNYMKHFMFIFKNFNLKSLNSYIIITACRASHQQTLNNKMIQAIMVIIVPNAHVYLNSRFALLWHAIRGLVDVPFLIPFVNVLCVG